MWKFLDDNGACIVLHWLLIMCHIKTVCIVPDITNVLYLYVVLFSRFGSFLRMIYWRTDV